MGLFRVLLAICVLFGHSLPLGPFGWVWSSTAVEMFFVISGFYMQMILLEKYTPERLGRRYVTRFYLARYSRLAPAYFTCLILTLLAAVAYYVMVGRPAPLVQSWAQLNSLPLTWSNGLMWVWAVVCNATMGLQDLALVLGIRGDSAVFTWDRFTSDLYVPSLLVIPPAWSLSVELVFYVVAPFILRARNSVLLWFFVAALVTRAYGLIFLHGTHDLTNRLPPFVMVDFLAGALVYRYRGALTSLTITQGPAGKLIAYTLVVLLTSCFPAEVSAGPWAPMMVALTAFSVPTIFAATRRSALDNTIGELSYPFYTFHLLVLYSVLLVQRITHVGEHWPTLVVWISLIGTLAVAYLVCRVELTFLEPWRQRLAVARA